MNLPLQKKKHPAHGKVLSVHYLTIYANTYISHIQDDLLTDSHKQPHFARFVNSAQEIRCIFGYSANCNHIPPVVSLRQSNEHPQR